MKNTIEFKGKVYQSIEAESDTILKKESITIEVEA